MKFEFAEGGLTWTTSLPPPPCGVMVTVPLVTRPPGVGCLPVVATVRTGSSETAKPPLFGTTVMPGSSALTRVGVYPPLTETWKVESALTEPGPLRTISCRCAGEATLLMHCQGKFVPLQLGWAPSAEVMNWVGLVHIEASEASGSWQLELGVPVDQSSASPSLSHCGLGRPVPGLTVPGLARPKSWKTMGSSGEPA